MLTLALGIWGMWPQKREVVQQPSRMAGEKICDSCPMVIRGISAQEIKEARLAYSFKADEFKIHPRAFGVFLFQPIKEATLVNAIMDVYLSAQGNSAQEIDLFPASMSASALSSSSDPEARKLAIAATGVITRLVFQNLHTNIHKDKKIAIAIAASEALTDLKSKETRLKGFTIEDKISNKSIATRNATWDANEKVFKIPGEYTAVTLKGTAKGYGIKVNLDFKVSKMN